MIKSMNIAWWVQRWSELHPQKTAIRFEEESISYPEFLGIYMASARIGAIFVPVNFRLAEPELDHILKNALPFLITEQGPLKGTLNAHATL